MKKPVMHVCQVSHIKRPCKQHYLRKLRSLFLFLYKTQQKTTSTANTMHTSLMELHYSNSCQQFLANIYSTNVLTSNPFLVGPQTPQPLLICLCTNYMHNTKAHAHNQTNKVCGVDTTSLQWGPE